MGINKLSKKPSISLHSFSLSLSSTCYITFRDAFVKSPGNIFPSFLAFYTEGSSELTGSRPVRPEAQHKTPVFRGFYFGV